MLKKDVYILTNSQRNIWNTEQYYSGTSINNICGSVFIKEDTDLILLSCAINKFIENNDSFKTRIKLIDGVPYQYFVENKTYEFETLEFQDIEELHTYAKKMTKIPFQIIDSQLFEFKLYKLPNGFGGFIINAHHIISDAATFGLIGTEVTENYSKLKKGEDIPQKDFSYIDYIESEQLYLSSPRFEKDKLYWNELYSSVPTTATIPTLKSECNSIEANRIEYKFDKKLLDNINTFCKNNKISIYNFLISIYSIYLGKINNSNNFSVGTPILNRSNFAEKHTSGMFISTSLLNINTENNPSFRDFVQNIAKTSMSMLKHQKYDYQYILEDLRKIHPDVPNLYDIVLSYQVTKAANSNLDISYEIAWYMTPFISNSLNIHFHDNNDDGNLSIDYDYKTCKYDENDIVDIHNRILHILKQIIENPNINIDNIEILTSDEKNKVIYEFNNTFEKYSENKTIVSLFEEQVEKTPNNIALVFENTVLTYKELNEKANSLAFYLRNNKKIMKNDLVGIMVNRSCEMIISILAVLKSGSAYIPIDPTYPESRISYMLENSNSKILLTQKHLHNKIKFENTVCIDLNNDNIYCLPNKNLPNINSPEDLAYVIFTSGSTGNPKGVMLKHKALSNLANYCNNYIDYLKVPKYKTIVSITTVSFDIFIFETLISLQRGLKLIIANENEQTSPDLLNKLIQKHNIQIIQSTPSRMQILINNIDKIPAVKNLKYITLAGEQLPLSLVNKIHDLWNPIIYNGYGPSETTVFSTLTKMNNIKINIGKPLYNTQIYILDNNLNPVPIGIPGELYISGDGVGKGYLNNSELTKRSFIPNPFIKNTIMYKTGDAGIYTRSGEIICLGRLDNQVKIRGLRIELEEIENELNKLSDINSCVVAKKNLSQSHEVLCAYFTANTVLDVSHIRKALEKSLPRYMIPSYFIQMDKLPYTHNGKIDRKKLPEPEQTNIKRNIILPRNTIDSTLVELLKKILNIDELSIDDNFFDLGGDSLSAINLSVQVQDKLNTELLVKDIMEHPTIQDLSDIINKKDNKLNQQIYKIPNAEFYNTSSAQKRIYSASKIAENNSLLYNIPGGVILDGLVDATKLEKCINILINRHESFRTYFEVQNENVVQKIVESIDFKLETIHNAEYKNINSLFNEFVKPFDLSIAPLFRAKLIYFSNGKSSIFIDMHHIISDGTSLAIFTDELCKLYNDKTLPELNITYKDFSNFENTKLANGTLKDSEQYWLGQFKDEIPVLNLPTKHPRPTVQSFEGKKIYFTIDAKTTKKINELSKQLGITPYMYLLSCYYILLSKYTSQEDIVIGSPIVNRNLADTYSIIGMFVNSLPLRNKINTNLSFKDFTLNIKNNLLEAYKYQEYPFDELVNKLNIKKDTSRQPLFDTMFIYQNNGLSKVDFKDIKATYYIPDTNISKFDLSLEAIPQNNEIQLSFEYCTKLFDEKFIMNLSNHYLNILNNSLENINTQIFNIDILSNKEQNKIIYEFNNTHKEYDENKTLTSLFEKQVAKTPNNVAIVFENQELTYNELNKKANSLAFYLRNEKKLERNDIVGIMVNRSCEMIISILAVLKAGGSYIPIDPTFPKARIDYMLNTSNAKFVLTQKHLKDNIDFSNIILVDLKNSELYNMESKNPKNINQPEDLSYIIFTSGSTGTPKGVMLKHKSLSNLANYCNNYIDYLKNSSYKTIVSITTVSFDIFIFETLISLQKGLKLVIANENEQTSPDLLNKLIQKHNIQIIQSTPSRMQLLINNIDKIPAIKNLEYITLAGEQLPLSLVNKIYDLWNPTIYNGYGPSETTVFSTLTKMNNKKITIGKPLDNTQIYILDKNLKPVPIGVSGELYIAGDGVGKGYLNNKNLTNKSFVQNPYLPNTLMYKTGDAGMYTEEGNIICLGRLDNQVKIRGLRIELDEIESELNKLPDINSCVVVKKIISHSHEVLCAYFTANTEVNITNLRKALEKSLPKYMVPTYFMQLDLLPYTPNGKIDRNKLPVPHHTSNSSEVLPARNNTDAKLIELFKTVLNINTISINDNFFELGGDSLSAINLSIQIQDELNVQIYARDILENPTIQELSDIITKMSTISIPKIEPIKKASFYNISSAQKRMYFASKIAGSNSILYNTSGGLILDGVIDEKRLENCFNVLINRHESFRTYFEIQNENVVQKILDSCHFKLEIVENAIFEDIDDLFKDFVKPFDLSIAPLFRAKLIYFSNGKSAIFIDMHHIISDGTSLNIFANELCKLYNGESLPEISITYKDFANFENERILNDDFKEAENYWINQFKTEIPILNMPTIHPRPAVQNFEGKKLYSLIDSNTTSKLETLSKQIEATPYMILLACYYILLYKYTSQDDIVVGSPIVNRSLAKNYSLIGMFVNSLALRTKIDKNLSFKEFVLIIKDYLLEAYKYQDYPFDELVDKLNIKRDTSRQPLFDTMFVYQNNGLAKINFNNIKTTYYIPDTNIAKYDLSLEAIPTDDKIQLSFEYATSLFDEEYIKKLSEHYLKILNIILDNTNIKLSNINMITSKEQDKILYEFNNNTPEYINNPKLTDLFETQVEKNANNTAIIFENRKLTYKDLNEKSNSLANCLINNGVNNKDVVCICLNRSLELIIAIFAVIKSGASYVLINHELPKERIKYIVNDSQSNYCIVNSLSNNLINISNSINIDNFDYSKYSNKNVTLENYSDNLCIIYTSGSTGNPKGVMLHKHGFVNLVLAFDKKLELSKYSTILGLANITFDMFASDLFGATLLGNTFVLANEEQLNSPIEISNLITQNNVEFLVTTPSRIELLLLEECNNPLKNVKAFILGGEKFPSNLYNKLRSVTDAQIYNGYGPTEITACCTLKHLTSDENITIGTPISNVQAYICDNNSNLVPIGLTGEICIAGAGVTNGYINNKEQTSKSFIKNPFGTGYLYKTGDLGKYTLDGEIEYLGRSDNQVKIRGIRIELEEIESVILNYPLIDNVTLVKQNINNKEFITAYYVEKQKINVAELKKYLLAKLPSYMVPSYYIPLKQFPHTQNGKIDKGALPLPTEIMDIHKDDYVAPKTQMQKQIATIWKKILKTKPIGITDNFFELGGDSLLAMNLSVELLNISKKISYQDIYRYPTISELEEKIRTNNNELLFDKIESLSENYVEILKNTTKLKKFKTYHPSNILLTGSTGYLGIHILEQFIRKEKGNIYCIVREGKSVTAKTKLYQKLNYYFGNKYDDLLDKRIIVITGDITKPAFGLNQNEILDLANSIDLVINSAASVAHFGDYKQFYDTNVKSVKHITDFCKSFNKKLYHISTLSVSGMKLDNSYPAFKKKNNIIFDESSLYVGQVLDDVYSRSKFDAESYVLDAIHEGVDGYILRMGNLMPRLRDGKFQENILDNDFVNKIIAFIKIGMIPDYLQNLPLNFTPIDQASRAIYKIVTHTNNTNRIFHLFNHNNIQVNKILKILKNLNYNVKILTEEDFKNKIEKILHDENSKYLIRNLMNDFDKNLHLDYKFDIVIKSNFTIKYLKKTFFRWHKISNKYLVRFINLLREEF